MSRCI